MEAAKFEVSLLPNTPGRKNPGTPHGRPDRAWRRGGLKKDAVPQ
jgi:hypothetical protein